jgi:hypothetical protein
MLVAGLAGMRPLPSFAATTVSFDCFNPTESALSTDITNAGSGGTVTFNCASATTIPFTSPVTLSQSVTLDASGATGAVTFDGGGTTQLSIVNSGVSLTLKGLTLAHGYAAGPWGGAIQNSGTLAITNSTLSGNSDSYAAGAIYNDGNGTLTITGSTLSGNSASYGGAILNFHDLTVTTSTFSGNHVGASGGAIYTYLGPANIAASTFSGNSAYWGGAIYQQDVALSVTSSTLSGNSAGYGGAIANYGTVKIATSTLAGNSASVSGGTLYVFSASDVIGGSIIANSSGASNCAGTITDNGSNLSNDSSCGFSAAKGDLVNTNPKLGPLANNGGPTKTMALAPTSPAIDKIPTSAASLCATGGMDQRGVSRLDNGESTCDMGAYEFQNDTSLTTTTGGTVSLGSGTTVTDSATLSGGSNPTGTITFYLFAPGVTPNATDSNTVYADAVTVSGDGIYSTTGGSNPGGYLPPSVGAYQWLAVYSGDATNLGATSTLGSEPAYVDTNLAGFSTLCNVSLKGAYLGGANLAGDDLCDSKLSGVNFTAANLSGADLTNANLSSAILVDATLTNANLTQANLKGADLTQANLTGAQGMTSASLSGVVWNKTTCPDNTQSDQDGGTCLNNLTP